MSASKVDRDGEFASSSPETRSARPVPVRILLPVHEMLGRRDLERIARRFACGNAAPAAGARSAAQPDRPVVVVARDVVEADQDRHADRTTLIATSAIGCKFQAAAGRRRSPRPLPGVWQFNQKRQSLVRSGTPTARFRPRSRRGAHLARSASGAPRRWHGYDRE